MALTASCVHEPALYNACDSSFHSRVVLHLARHHGGPSAGSTGLLGSTLGRSNVPFLNVMGGGFARWAKTITIRRREAAAAAAKLEEQLGTPSWPSLAQDLQS